MACSTAAVVTIHVSAYLHLPISLANTDDYSSAFAGQYGVDGIGGNYADGGKRVQYTGYDGYWFATNKYIDYGNVIPVNSVNNLTMKANVGVGEYSTTLYPCTFYVSTNGKDWVNAGTAQGSNVNGATVVLIQAQLLSLDINSIRYFRANSTFTAVNEFYVTIQ